MICNFCGKSFPDNFEYCPYCGSIKEALREIKEIKQNINYLKTLKTYFETSLKNIEKGLQAIETQIPQKAHEKPAKTKDYPISKQTTKKEEKKTKKEYSFFEKFIGEKFFLTIGIIAVLFSAAFFLKYSFEKNLFTPIFRVSLTSITGIAFILAGLFLKSKYRIYGIILISGGIAVLFFANFASVVLYKLYGITPALIINIILLSASLYMATTFNSLFVSIIGIGGAYLTPLSLRTTISSHTGFLFYLFLLSLAPVFLSYKKKWASILLLSNIFSAMWFFVWYYSYFKSDMGLNFYYLGFWLFAVFSLTAIFFLKEKTNSVFLLSPALAIVIFPLISQKILLFGKISLLIPSMLYIGLGIILVLVSKTGKFSEKEKSFLFLSGITSVFAGIYLNYSPLTFTALSFISLMFFLYTAFLIKEKWPFYMSIPFALIIFFKAITYDAVENLGFDFDKMSFANYKNLHERFLEYFIVIGALALCYKISERMKEKFPTLSYKFLAGSAIFFFLSYEVPTIFYKLFSKGQSMSLTILWAAFAFTLLFLGLKKEQNGMKYTAYFLFAVVLFKVFFIDMFALSTIYKILSFFVTGIILIVSSYLYYKFGSGKEGKN